MFDSHLPNASLVRHDGTNTAFHDLLKSGVLIVSMFYADCDVKCVPVGRLVVRVSKLLGPITEDIRFAMITLDSRTDDVRKIREYRKKVGAESFSNIGFYTGEFDEIEHLRYRLGMYDEIREIDKDKSQHKSHFVVINNKGGQCRHVSPFKNPIEFARSIIQISPTHLGRYDAWKKIKDFDFQSLTNDELLENVSSLHPRYTIPFLPRTVQREMTRQAEKQKGLFTPLMNDKKRFPELEPGARARSRKCCCGDYSAQMSKEKLIEIPCTEQTTEPPVPP